MTLYEGSFFGFNFSKEFDTDEEFLTWFIAKLKKTHPLLVLLLDKVLTETIFQSQIQAAKAKLQELEARIAALEAKVP